MFADPIKDYQIVVEESITPIILPAATIDGNESLTYSLSRTVPSGLTFTAATRRITGNADDVRQWTAVLTATADAKRTAECIIIINTIPPAPDLGG